MDTGYLIDTNAAIDFLNNKLPLKISTLIYNTEINISVVTRMELLASPKTTSSQLKAIGKFISGNKVR